MKYRPEIDGLRAIAIVGVIIYHFWPDVLTQGFLGVDMFFVISGYVISGSIEHYSSDCGKTFLARFYAKRIWRLLPALFVSISFFIVAFLILSSRPESRIFTTASAALLGVSNIYLFSRSFDYFGLDSQLNPFTHTWSLGVEVQFYFFYALIWVAFRSISHRFAFARVNSALMLFVFCFASWIAYILVQPIHSNAAFYLAPFRFWEILLGCVVYACRGKFILSSLHNFFSTSLLALIIFCMSADLEYTAVSTSIICISSAILIHVLSGNSSIYVKRLLSTNAFTYIGQISYSLYLYHWPWWVLAMLTIGNSNGALILVLIFTFFSAIFSYHVVENFFRFKLKAVSAKNTLYFSSLATPIIAACVFTLAPRFVNDESRFLADLVRIARPEPWPELKCHGEIKIKAMQTPFDICLSARESQSPDIFLIGDSHASQLHSPLLEIAKRRNGKLYFINTQVDDFPLSFLKSASTENDRILTRLLKVASKEDTIVVSFHRGRFNVKLDRHTDLKSETKLSDMANNFEENMRYWLIRFKDKRVPFVLVQDTPLLTYVTTIETCALQQQLWNQNACTVSFEQDMHSRMPQSIVFSRLHAQFPSHIHVFETANTLYGNSREFNPIRLDGSYRMNDWNHISTSEAMRLVQPLESAINALKLGAPTH